MDRSSDMVESIGDRGVMVTNKLRIETTETWRRRRRKRRRRRHGRWPR